MKKILFMALAIVLGLVSCVKDEKYPGLTITDVKYTPTAVSYFNNVTVYATIKSFTGVTAELVYNAGTEDKTVAMTNVDNIFSAVIPAQPNDTKVSFYVKAKNENMTNISATMEYTVGAVQIDYSKLRLNELNGNDKFIEIYNAGAEAINMAGCYIEKDAEQKWSGTADITIEAGGYLLLYSEDVAASHTEVPENHIFHSGLSAKKNVRIQLFTPAGESIDDFNLVDIDLNDPSMIPAPASYSRNADGEWYYADATPGAVNVNGSTPLLGLENDGPTPPAEPDYTNLVLNELNGDTKFIEFYNKGDLDISVEGMYLVKDDGTEPRWIGAAGTVVPAYGYLLLYSEDVVVPGEVQEGYPEELVFHSGLSAKKTIKYALYMPDGTERDVFTRGETGEWGQTISNVAPQSYARTPDGGDWKLAEPTPGEANPDNGEEIPQV